MERFSLRSNESGGGGTCRDFWELTRSTSSPRWQATASTSAPKSPWWQNAAPPHAVLLPVKMTSPLSECWEMLRLWQDTQTNESVLYTHRKAVTRTTSITCRLLLCHHSCRNCASHRSVGTWGKPCSSWWWFGVWCVFYSRSFTHIDQERNMQVKVDSDIWLCFIKLLTLKSKWHWFYKDVIKAHFVAEKTRLNHGSHPLPHFCAFFCALIMLLKISQTRNNL